MNSVLAGDAPAASRWSPSRRNAHWSLVAVIALLAVTSLFAVPTGGHATLAPTAVSGAPIASPGAVLSGASLAAQPYLTSPGTPLSSLPNATVQGPVAPDYPMSFTVGFPMQHAQQLAQVIQAQSTPGSPMFHQWLTLDQIRSEYGADPVAYQDTINYFTSLGFHVQTEGTLSVSFSGSAALVNQAFRTQVSMVGYGQGQSAAMNSQPLSLPSSLASAISTVNGINQEQVAHPEHILDPLVAADLGISPTSASMAPIPGAALPLATALAQSQYSNISTIYNVSNRAFFWFYYYSHHSRSYHYWQDITPASLNWLYGGTQLTQLGYTGNSTGSPITIAIVMAGGINPSDLRGYAQLAWNNPNQIMSRLTAIPVDGSFTTNGTVTYTDGASGEMALDIEYSSTMAPGARIMPVYGPCLCTNVLDDDYATMNNMLRVPNIVSNSWGGDEDAWPNLYGPNWQNDLTMHDYIMQLTSRGSTVLASSGDGGGFDTGSGILSGSYPATDPYVLSVNGLRTAAQQATGTVFPMNSTFGIANVSLGTNSQEPFLYNYPLHVGQADKIAYQSYWYEPIANTTLYNAPPSGSGGFGTSYWFNQTWVEHGYTVPDLGRSLGSGVAAEADFNESIFFDGGFQFFYGGTSFACPTTAGEFALTEDYLLAHGHNPLLGEGNGPVYAVANAWYNGNLSLVPFYNIASRPGISSNGTSYWGNYGVLQGYSWPPGQKYPTTPSGVVTYGNTTPGYNFPTGWGSINVYNFAVDLNYLEGLPGTFWTVNSAGTSWDTGAWEYMTLNQTYNIDMNATGAFAASSPKVTVVFHGADGTVTAFQPALTATFTPSSGYRFILNTGIAPFNEPGFVIFEFGNSTTHTLGFSYDWISYPTPAGNLSISVVQPSGGQILSGYPQFNPWPFGYFAPVIVSPGCCTNPNSITVKVTFDGRPVYNAFVTAEVPTTSVLAWQGTRAQQVTQSLGNAHELSPTILSGSFTSQDGTAIVYTWNLIRPTIYYINASYGSAKASTTYDLTPGPNVKLWDNYGGKYSRFDTIAYILQQLRQPITPQTEDLWATNSQNQSGYYNLLYGWQGELLNVSANNWTGSTMSGIKIWFGNLDVGGENKFHAYQPTFGVVGVTNWTGQWYNTYNTTTAQNGGNVTIQIPDNESHNNFFAYPNGETAGFGFLAASMPGQYNRTFSYTEPCAPTLPNPKTTITCQFNDTFQRNYSAVPILILPNPVNTTTETQQHTARDFFNVGSNISWHVNVNLPAADPFVSGYGFNWPAGLEHLVSVKAYVDGAYAGSLTPSTPPYWQNWTADGNLTGDYSPGVHHLVVVAVDSLGHVFTRTHTFIVGSITLDNLGLQNTYTVVPYVMNWTYQIPVGDMNNHTFSQSLDIRYVAPGCGGTTSPCPQVVNYTMRILDGVVNYNQSLNLTLLGLDHFYSGDAQPPPGQYQLIVWLNANHSGSIAALTSTYLVFSPVTGAITGPSANQLVPLGNVTLGYTYSGDYVQNASLAVYPGNATTGPVFTIGAFIPGQGLRGGSASWPAVDPGTYRAVLSLGTPYGSYNATQWFNVSSFGNVAYVNQTPTNPVLGGMNAAVVATALALVAGIIGLLLGLFIAPGLRGSRAGRPASGAAGAAAAAPVKPWDEQASSVPGSAPVIRCAVCKDSFSTDFALHQHLKIVHGIEE